MIKLFQDLFGMILLAGILMLMVVVLFSMKEYIIGLGRIVLDIIVMA